MAASPDFDGELLRYASYQSISITAEILTRRQHVLVEHPHNRRRRVSEVKLTLHRAGICPTLILSVFVSAATSTASPIDTTSSKTLLVAPLADRSEFRGEWNLSSEVARSLSRRMSVSHSFVPISFDTLNLGSNDDQKLVDETVEAIRVGRMAGADYVIYGSIVAFNITRYGVSASGLGRRSWGGGDANLVEVGAPLAGGYRHFVAVVNLRVVLVRSADGKVIAEPTGESELRDNDLGFSFFGKPRDVDRQFYGLDLLKFDSTEFAQTLIGRAFEEAASEIVAAVPTDRPDQSLAASGAIVAVDGAKIYINLGFDDGVTVGQRFSVSAPGDTLRDPVSGAVLGRIETPVGTLQVSTVLAPHLSTCTVSDSTGAIKRAQIVRSSR
ncbi:MAG: CsgG/HfaB family protein [Candidatus Latescibacteria bacterium]|nr:CsgG/HfaB family protein [Candidatus Latescibacterota bacterium]